MSATTRTTSTDVLVSDLLVARWAEHAPEAVAIERGGTRLTYADLLFAVDALVGEMTARAIVPGDAVAIFIPNSPEYIVSLLAVLHLGAVAIPVADVSGAERVAHILSQTAPRICLRVETGARAPLVSPLLDAVPSLIVRVPATPGEKAPRLTGPPRGRTDATALILFTSGSTGLPKGVVLTHRQLLAASASVALSFHLDQGHRDLAIAPMTHSGGWQRIAATLYAGGTVVIPTEKIDAANLLRHVKDLCIQGFNIPVPLLRLAMRHPAETLAASLESVRSIDFVSAPTTSTELAALCAALPAAEIFSCYGLTECTRATVLDVRRQPSHRDSVGRPVPGVEVSIRDVDGHPVAVGSSGEIYLRGRQRSDSYFADEELNAARFRDGWLATGDSGFIDEEGFLTLLGRHDDLITAGGHHFYPAEVERELGEVPATHDYIVAGIPDPAGVLGAILHAFIVVKDDDEQAVGEFLRTARQRLPAHMVPRRVVVVSAIPQTASGKPDRRSTINLFGPRN